MSVLNRIAAFWRNLFRKGDVEQELSDELAYALDALVEKKITEGLSEVEARRQAAIELGGVEQLKEKVREAKAGYYIEGVGRDLRYAGRMFFKNPGFTAVAIIALALGIGANTAIFSLVNGVLLRPLPFPDAERIIYIEGKNPRRALPRATSRFSTLLIGRNKPISSRAPPPTGPATPTLVRMGRSRSACRAPV